MLSTSFNNFNILSFQRNSSRPEKTNNINLKSQTDTVYFKSNKAEAVEIIEKNIKLTVYLFNNEGISVNPVNIYNYLNSLQKIPNRFRKFLKNEELVSGLVNKVTGDA